MLHVPNRKFLQSTDRMFILSSNISRPGIRERERERLCSQKRDKAMDYGIFIIRGIWCRELSLNHFNLPFSSFFFLKEAAIRALHCNFLRGAKSPFKSSRSYLILQ